MAQSVVIVDASVTVPFLGGDESWSERWQWWTETDVLLMAPSHYPVEVANALVKSARLPAIEVAAHIQRLFTSGVEIADRGLTGLLGAIELAAKHRLSVYDASYLHLAIDVDGPLATVDQALARAALAEGVEIVSTEAHQWAAAASDPEFQQEAREIEDDFREKR
jgi:predicted nucleic acid-binding protein